MQGLTFPQILKRCIKSMEKKNFREQHEIAATGSFLNNERLVDFMAKIKLQGISQRFDGVAAKDLRIGDILIWNYGYKSEIVNMQPSKTGKTFVLSLKSFETGNISERKTTAAREFVVERKEPESPIDRAIKGRKCTHNSIYSDVGCALDSFTTAELAEYYMQRFGDGGLRYFLEQQIIAAEINAEKAI